MCHEDHEREFREIVQKRHEETGGALMILYTVAIPPSTSHPYKAEVEHARCAPDQGRNRSPSAKLGDVLGNINANVGVHFLRKILSGPGLLQNLDAKEKDSQYPHLQIHSGYIPTTLG